MSVSEVSKIDERGRRTAGPAIPIRIPRRRAPNDSVRPA